MISKSRFIALGGGIAALAAIVLVLSVPARQAFADPTINHVARVSSWSVLDIDWSARLRLKARSAGANLEVCIENFVLPTGHPFADPNDLVLVPETGSCVLNGTVYPVTVASDGSLRALLPQSEFVTDFTFLLRVFDSDGTEIGHYGRDFYVR